MSEIVSKLLSMVQSLRFRDVLILLSLVLIAFPVWLTWRVVESPEKLGAIIELYSGHRVTGAVLSCQILESRYSSRPSFQVVKVIDLPRDDNKSVGLHVHSLDPIASNESRDICRVLEQFEKSIIGSLEKVVK